MDIDCYLLAADDNYNYLINGQALSEVEEFIANGENTYEDFIEVCSICAIVDVLLISFVYQAALWN